MSEGMIALIPARAGSKGVPNKNIKLLNGVPLIGYTIEACKRSERITRIMVSTDCKKIAEIARQCGAEIPFIRPAKYAQDDSTDHQVIKHFIDETGVDEVAYMRPTTPIRLPEIIDRGIELFFENKESMSGLRSMHELPEPPHKMFKLGVDGFCKGFFEHYNGIKDYTNLPRQTFPIAYQPNGYIDIAKKQTLLSCGTAFGTRIMPLITENVIEIDSHYEYQLLEYQMKIREHQNAS